MLSKKLIIIIAVAVIVLGGGGFGAYTVMSKRKAAALAAKAEKEKAAGEHPEGAEAKGGEEEEEDAHAGGGGHEEGGASGPAILVLKPIVNLQSPGKNAYLKCELDIVFRDPELGKLAAGDKPSYENSVIKSLVLAMLAEKTLEEAADPETREALRMEIKEKLNEKFAPKPLKPGEKEDPKHKKPKHPIKDVLVVEWAIAR